MAMKLYPETDVQAIASAIRSKNGSASLYKIGDMAAAISEISSGFSADDIAKRSYTGDIVLSLTSANIVQYAFNTCNITSFSAPTFTGTFGNYAFTSCANLVSVSAPVNEKGLASQIFKGCTSLTTVNLPKIRALGSDAFYGCTSLVNVAFPQLGATLNYVSNGVAANAFQNCTSLQTCDVGIAKDIAANAFNGCSSLSNLIMRRTSICSLSNVNAFTGSPAASGGTGINIYIPKSLYDHLGDNGSSDYKAATNWTTINGYGTITWHAIEGSYYETHYGDGTEIIS